MWYLGEDGTLDPILKDIPEAYNMPRQQLPDTYYQNGNVDLLRPRNVTELHSMTGKKIKGYVMKEMYDVDTEADLPEWTILCGSVRAVSCLCLTLTV